MISGRKPMGGGSNFCGVGDLRGAAFPFDWGFNLFCCGADAGAGGGGGGGPTTLPGCGGGGGGPVGSTWKGIPIAVAPNWEAAGVGPPLLC